MEDSLTSGKHQEFHALPIHSENASEKTNIWEHFAKSGNFHRILQDVSKFATLEFGAMQRCVQIFVDIYNTTK